VQEGGFKAWFARLRDPALRERVAREMRAPGKDWENLYLAAGGAEGVLLVSFKNERLKPLTGKTLAEVAKLRSESPEETAIDLVVEDESRVGACYFVASEENLRRQVALPWMSFGSDEGAPAPEGVFLKSNPHPRAYGTFARLLGHYVRDEGLASLEDVIQRLTSFPAENLGLSRRGRLARGYFADVVAFDASSISEHATYADPHHYATGMLHVFVNGEPVLRDGEHTGARPGRVLAPRRD
jgi:N-acyl-D-amino-acid deacylase